MKVIAISGWKRSGKDASAEYLIKNHNFKRVAFADVLKDMVADEYDIERSHCDDPAHKEQPLEGYPVTPKDDFSMMIARMMFREFRDINGNAPIDFYIDPSGAFLGVMGRDVAQLYWTPRALCILKGSSNRAVDSSFWVGRAVREIKTFQANAPWSSMETSKVVYNGNCVISDLRYISEVEQLRAVFGKDLIVVRINRFDECQSQDPSERNLDNYKGFDYIIENRGTIEELYANLDRIVKND